MLREFLRIVSIFSSCWHIGALATKEMEDNGKYSNQGGLLEG